MDNGSEFYNILVKSWLQDNDTEMYLIYNKVKYVSAERFIKIARKKLTNV